MSFRVLNQSPVYLNKVGQPCANGSLTFYENLTTTEKDVYGDAALSVNNGNVLALDSSGRVQVGDVWGSGIYTAVLKDAAGNVIWTKDYVQDLSVVFPSGSIGQVLSTDGGSPPTYSFVTLLAVPDPTGSANKTIRTDGTNIIWGIPDLSAGGGGTMYDWIASNVRTKTQTLTSTATLTVDLTAGNTVVLNQATDCELTFTGFPASGESIRLTLIRIKDATATARALTFAVAPKWAGSAPPTVTQTSACIDVLEYLFHDGGTTPLGVNSRLNYG